MGGRGTYAVGNDVPFQYKTVGTVDGVKVLEKNNEWESRNLPEESHSSKAYLQMNVDGSFSKYREYGKDHTLLLEIEYGTHQGKRFLHYHEYVNGERQEAHSIQERPEYIAKYGKFFKGVKI